MTRVVLLAVAVVASGTGTLAALRAGVSAETPTVQPLPFNHRLHGSNGVECKDCHEGVESSAAAGTPRLERCMECHGEDDAETPDKARMKSLSAAGGDLAWVRLYRLPAHVVFSHERHVALGGLACDLCHGGHGTSEEPPPSPERAVLTMEGCTACHEARGASGDCIACHR